jgi:hypothetical protein
MRMPVGFFDDPSFRWAGNQARTWRAPLQLTPRSSTLASWAAIAPSRPRNPSTATTARITSDLDALALVPPAVTTCA